jgi:hypothetical protein
MSQMKILTAWARYRNGEIFKKKRDKLCRAGIAGKAGLGLSAVRRAAVQPEGESGWFKRMIKAMDPRLWKSKKTIKHEAEVEAKRLAQEAADKAKQVS